ncbi:hypothetical protein E4U39_000182 [Claviceps sp. Clav50 group G5]|nr:hypothetical protein E4U39_000182 [Claviceps sp. Clav50 group G5]
MKVAAWLLSSAIGAALAAPDCPPPPPQEDIFDSLQKFAGAPGFCAILLQVPVPTIKSIRTITPQPFTVSGETKTVIRNVPGTRRFETRTFTACITNTLQITDTFSQDADRGVVATDVQTVTVTRIHTAQATNALQQTVIRYLTGHITSTVIDTATDMQSQAAADASAIVATITKYAAGFVTATFYELVAPSHTNSSVNRGPTTLAKVTTLSLTDSLIETATNTRHGNSTQKVGASDTETTQSTDYLTTTSTVASSYDVTISNSASDTITATTTDSSTPVTSASASALAAAKNREKESAKAPVSAAATTVSIPVVEATKNKQEEMKKRGEEGLADADPTKQPVVSNAASLLSSACSRLKFTPEAEVVYYDVTAARPTVIEDVTSTVKADEGIYYITEYRTDVLTKTVHVGPPINNDPLVITITEDHTTTIGDQVTQYLTTLVTDFVTVSQVEASTQTGDAANPPAVTDNVDATGAHNPLMSGGTAKAADVGSAAQTLFTTVTVKHPATVYITVTKAVDATVTQAIPKTIASIGGSVIQSIVSVPRSNGDDSGILPGETTNNGHTPAIVATKGSNIESSHVLPISALTSDTDATFTTQPLLTLSSVTAAAISTSTSAVNGLNLIKNGDFETGVVAPWISAGNYSLVKGHESVYGLSLRTPPPTSDASRISQTIDTVPGTLYRLSFYMNPISGGSNSILTCTASAVNAVGVGIKVPTNVDTNRWSLRSFTFTAPGTSIIVEFELDSAVALEARLDDTGSTVASEAILDDISVVVVSYSSQQPPSSAALSTFPDISISAVKTQPVSSSLASIPDPIISSQPGSTSLASILDPATSIQPVSTSLVSISDPAVSMQPVSSSLASTSDPAVSMQPVSSSLASISDPAVSIQPVPTSLASIPDPVVSSQPVSTSLVSISDPTVSMQPVSSSLASIPDPVVSSQPVSTSLVSISDPTVSMQPVSSSLASIPDSAVSTQSISPGIPDPATSIQSRSISSLNSVPATVIQPSATTTSLSLPVTSTDVISTPIGTDPVADTTQSIADTTPSTAMATQPNVVTTQPDDVTTQPELTFASATVPIISASTGAAAVNMVKNGDFEAGTVVPWTPAGEYSLVEGHNSVYGLSLRTMPPTLYTSSISQTIETVPGTLYRLSFYMKPITGGSNSILTSTVSDAVGTNIKIPTNVDINKWSLKSFMFTAPGTSIVVSFKIDSTVALEARDNTGSTVASEAVLDDISVIMVPFSSQPVISLPLSTVPDVAASTSSTQPIPTPSISVAESAISILSSTTPTPSSISVVSDLPASSIPTPSASNVESAVSISSSTTPTPSSISLVSDLPASSIPIPSTSVAKSAVSISSSTTPTPSSISVVSDLPASSIPTPSASNVESGVSISSSTTPTASSLVASSIPSISTATSVPVLASNVQSSSIILSSPASRIESSVTPTSSTLPDVSTTAISPPTTTTDPAIITTLPNLSLPSAIVPAVTSSTGATDGANLLRNGDFETGAISPWIPAGTYSLVSGRNSAHGISLRTSPSTSFTGVISQTITTKPGTLYRFSFFMNPLSGGSNSILTCTALDAVGTSIKIPTNVDTNQWSQKSFTFTAPGASIIVDCKIDSTVAAEALLDDISVTLASSSTLPASSLSPSTISDISISAASTQPIATTSTLVSESTASIQSSLVASSSIPTTMITDPAVITTLPNLSLPSATIPAVSASTGAADGANLLKNGDFETGAISPWIPAGTYSLVAGRNSAHGISLRTSPPTSLTGIISQTITTKPGTLYRFSFFMNPLSGGSNSILTCTALDAVGTSIKIPTNVDTNQWSQRSFTFTAPGASIIVGCKIDSTVAAEALLDDISVTLASSSSSLSSSSLSSSTIPDRSVSVSAASTQPIPTISTLGSESTVGIQSSLVTSSSIPTTMITDPAVITTLPNLSLPSATIPAVSASTGAADGTNLVKNGDFETGALSPWIPAGTYSLVAGRNSAHGISLRTSPPTSLTGIISQTITTKPGTLYRFSFYMNPLSGGSNSILTCTALDAVGTSIKIPTNVDTNQWSQKSFTFTAPGASIIVGCKIDSTVAAEALLDDISVTLASSSSSLPSSSFSPTTSPDVSTSTVSYQAISSTPISSIQSSQTLASSVQPSLPVTTGAVSASLSQLTSTATSVPIPASSIQSSSMPSSGFVSSLQSSSTNTFSSILTTSTDPAVITTLPNLSLPSATVPAVTVSTGAADGANLLKNGDFETGALSPWIPAGTYSLVAGRNSAHGISLRTSPPTSATGIISQTITTKPGTLYRFSFFMNPLSGGSNSILTCTALDAVGTSIKIPTNVDTNQWSQRSFTFTAPGASIIVGCKIDSTVAAEALLDDISVTLASSSTLPVSSLSPSTISDVSISAASTQPTATTSTLVSESTASIQSSLVASSSIPTTMITDPAVITTVPNLSLPSATVPAVSASTGAADGTNLLKNGDFETGALSPWIPAGTYSLVAGRNSAHGISLHTSPPTSVTGIISQTITTKPGTLYRFSFFMNPLSGGSNSILTCTALDAVGTSIKIPTNVDTNQWSQKSFTFTAPGASIIVGCKIDSTVAAEALLDDISVTLASSSSSLSSSSLSSSIVPDRSVSVSAASTQPIPTTPTLGSESTVGIQSSLVASSSIPTTMITDPAVITTLSNLSLPSATVPAVSASTGAADGANLLKNGDFETGAISPWIPAGTYSLVAGRNSAHGISLHTSPPTSATGIISQTITTKPGALYRFSFFMNPLSGGSNSILTCTALDAVGTSIKIPTNVDTNQWSQKSFTFTAPGASIIVGCKIDSTVAAEALLDDISVTLASSSSSLSSSSLSSSIIPDRSVSVSAASTQPIPTTLTLGSESTVGIQSSLVASSSIPTTMITDPAVVTTLSNLSLPSATVPAVSASTGAADGTNLVKNGDFETGALSPWIPAGTYSLVAGRNSAHGISLRTSPPTSLTGIISQTITTKPGTLYRFSFYMNPISGGSNSILTCTALDAVGTSIKIPTNVDTNQWSQKSFTFTAPGASIIVGCKIDSTVTAAEALLDDISVTLASSSNLPMSSEVSVPTGSTQFDPPTPTSSIHSNLTPTSNIPSSSTISSGILSTSSTQPLSPVTSGPVQASSIQSSLVPSNLVSSIQSSVALTSSIFPAVSSPPASSAQSISSVTSASVLASNIQSILPLSSSPVFSIESSAILTTPTLATVSPAFISTLTTNTDPAAITTQPNLSLPSSTVPVVTASTGAADGANLVKNGDFETGAISPWIPAGTYSLIAGRNSAHGISLRTSPPTSLTGIISQTITTKPGTLYRFSFYMNPISGDSNSILTCTALDAVGTSIKIPTNVETNQWSKKSFTFTAPGASIIVGCKIDSTVTAAEALLDDISVMVADSSSQSPSTPLSSLAISTQPISGTLTSIPASAISTHSSSTAVPAITTQSIMTPSSVTVSAASTSTAGACSLNLVQNGDFETGALSPWIPAGTYGLVAGRDSAHGISLRTSPPTSLTGIISQTITTKPGTLYRFSFYMKPISGDSNSILTCTALDAVGTSIKVPTNVGTNQWSQKSFTFTAPGASIVVGCKIDSTVAAEALLDDISVTQAC